MGQIIAIKMPNASTILDHTFVNAMKVNLRSENDPKHFHSCEISNMDISTSVY